MEPYAKKGGELGRAGLPRSVTLRLERNYGSWGRAGRGVELGGRC